MALELYMVGLVPKDIEQSREFYERLGLGIPEGSAGKRHIGVKMENGLTFFLNNTGLLDETDKPGLILEFFLSDRAQVDAKYAEMTGYGYKGYRAPVMGNFEVYYAFISDPDGNIIMLSAE